MINEEHISVTAKKDYVLLRAAHWKTDLASWKRKALSALPELRGWLCSAKGEDRQRGRPEDRGRWEDCQRRVAVQRGERQVCWQPLSTDASASFSTLVPCRLQPQQHSPVTEQAGSGIAGRPVSRWSPAETSQLQAIMQSDK